MLNLASLLHALIGDWHDVVQWLVFRLLPSCPNEHLDCYEIVMCTPALDVSADLATRFSLDRPLELYMCKGSSLSPQKDVRTTTSSLI